MSTISKKYKKSSSGSLARFDQTMWAPVLLGILFFFVLCLGATDSIKGMTLVMAVFMLIVIAARFGVLRDRIHLPFFALTLYVLMDGISTFYAVSGKFALREFLKVFLAFMMAVVLLATSPKKEARTGKRIAAILAVCTGVGSLIGIDMISTGWISGAVVWILSRFTEAYKEFSTVQVLNRMPSIFANSNVYAGVSGLGSLLGLGLASVSETNKERCFYLPILFLNALAFIMTISLGAFFFAFLALIVFVLMQQKENRIRALVLALEMLVLAGIVALLILKLPARAEDERSVLPLLCAVIGAAALCGVDLLVGKRIASKTLVHKKAALIAGVAVIVLAIGYAIAAFTVTGPITLEPGKKITRIVLYPKPGTYTMDVQENGEDPVKLWVRSRSSQQMRINDSSLLYSGDLNEVNFEIPEDSVMVYCVFEAPAGAQIDSARFGNYKLPLDYKLLPSFISDRLGKVGTFRDVSLRLAYFEDGLKLFKRSPIIGLGMGAFENAIKSVQSFYYETKYSHNHYFQTMLEIGIVGLALFLFLLISSAVAIWKSRKKHPFVPMLAALWMFMAGQALHDVVFSAYAYLPLAYGSFALIDLCFGEAIEKPKLSKTVKTVTIAVFCIFTVVYGILVAGNLAAKRKIDREPTMQALTQCVNLDRFEWADYALPYVNNAIGEDIDPAIKKQADAYAERLGQVNSNTIPIYLAEYYFYYDQPEQAFAMLEKYVDYVASDQKAWQTSFDVMRAHAQNTEVFRDGVQRLMNKRKTWNEENLGTITLKDTAWAWALIKDGHEDLLHETISIGTHESSGVTYSGNPDGSVTVQGEATDTSFYNIYQNKEGFPEWMEKGRTYLISINDSTEMVAFEIYLYDPNKEVIFPAAVSTVTSEVFTLPEEANGIIIRFRGLEGQTIDTTAFPSISFN